MHRKEIATQESSRWAAMPRLIPNVAFGLGVAVLAGVAIVTVPPSRSADATDAGHIMTTASLGAPINGDGVQTPTLTTNNTSCCV